MAWVPQQDPRLIYRLVGFIEYGKSLEFLDKFFKDAESEEIEIAEEIVDEQNQFAIYTNLPQASSNDVSGGTTKEAGRQFSPPRADLDDRVSPDRTRRDARWLYVEPAAISDRQTILI